MSVRRAPRRDPPHVRAVRRAVHVSGRAAGPVVAKLSLARAIAREAELAVIAAFPADARRGSSAARARRSGARAEPDLVGALPASRAGTSPGFTRQPPAAGSGARVEATEQKEDGEEDVSTQSAQEKKRASPRPGTRRSPRLDVERFAALLLRSRSADAGARVLEIGRATGQLTRALARRFDATSASPRSTRRRPFVAEAREDGCVDDLRAPIALRVGDRVLPATMSPNLVVSELA